MIDDVPERRMEEIDSYRHWRREPDEDSEAILDALEEMRRERAVSWKRTREDERAINEESTIPRERAIRCEGTTPTERLDDPDAHDA